MTKQELIALMVENYYSQVAVVGGATAVTLEDYLRGIMFRERAEDDQSEPWTEADLAYGLSLASK